MLENDEELIQALQAFHPVDSRLRLHLREVCHERVYPRHYHLLRPGQQANYAWFILEGSARAYYLHAQKGEEVTVWFWQQGDVLWALGSFCRGLPCRFYLQLLEDCRLLAVHRRDLEFLASSLAAYRQLERAIVEAYHTRVVRHFHDRTSLSVRERYGQLMQQNPRLFLEAPVKDIASFLGMYPDTLSRLRGEK